MQTAPPDGAVLFERVFETLTRGGHARLVAWLLLSGYDPFDSPAVHKNFKRIIDATHAARSSGSGSGSKAGRKVSYQDTQFTVVLSSLALLGQAIAGPAAFGAAGLPRSAAYQKRFRAWMAQAITQHLLRS